MNNSGIIMNIDFGDDEKLKICQNAFNDLCTKLRCYPEILQWDPTKLNIRWGTDKIPIYEWKSFLIHPSVKSWYRQEQQLLLDIQIQSLITEIANNPNSAKQAALASLLATRRQEESNMNNDMNNKIYIYDHLNLRDSEKLEVKNENPELHKQQPIQQPDKREESTENEPSVDRISFDIID